MNRMLKKIKNKNFKDISLFICWYIIFIILDLPKNATCKCESNSNDNLDDIYRVDNNNFFKNKNVAIFNAQTSKQENNLNEINYLEHRSCIESNYNMNHQVYIPPKNIIIGEDFDYEKLGVKIISLDIFKNFSNKEKITIFLSQSIVKGTVKQKNPEYFISLKDEKKIINTIKKIKIPNEFKIKPNKYALNLFPSHGFEYFVFSKTFFKILLEYKKLKELKEFFDQLNFIEVIQTLDKTHFMENKNNVIIGESENFAIFEGDKIENMCHAIKLKPFIISKKSIKKMQTYYNSNDNFLKNLFKNATYSIYYSDDFMSKLTFWYDSNGIVFPQIFKDVFTKENITDFPIFLDGLNRYINLSTYEKIKMTDPYDFRIKINPITKTSIKTDCPYQQRHCIDFYTLLNRLFKCGKKIEKLYKLTDRKIKILLKN